MQDLQVQLNNALRIVNGSKISDRIEIADLLNKTKTPSVNQLAAETTLMETWRQINYELPASEYFVYR